MNSFEPAQCAYHGMGTVISQLIYGDNSESALRTAKKETERLEKLLSRFLPKSDISKINRAAGIKAKRVSTETLELLSRAKAYSERTEGCFDVTIGPLVSLWHASGALEEAPCDADIERALPLVGFRSLHLGAKTAYLDQKGQSLDLGGIGKGYAADKVLEIFKTYGITSALVNFGGNVATIGTKPDKSPWRVGIRHPRHADALIGTLSVANKSVVTSGDDQRYFLATNGKRYHHIIDPLTGYPSDTGLLSVTIVSASSVEADALSTAVFTAGLEKGTRFLKDYPGTEAIIVGSDLSVYVTQGLKNSFQATENIDTYPI